MKFFLVILIKCFIVEATSYTALGCWLCAVMYAVSELVLIKWRSNCIFVCVHFINKWIEASVHWLFQDTRLNVYVKPSNAMEKGIDFNAFRFHYITFILPLIADRIGNIWWSSRTPFENQYLCTHTEMDWMEFILPFGKPNIPIICTSEHWTFYMIISFIKWIRLRDWEWFPIYQA